MGDLHLVSVEERLSWLKKQKELKTIFTTSNGLNIFVGDIETIWECQFSKLLEEGDNELNEDQNDLEMLKKSFFNFMPLKATDVFVGGRTENFSSFWHKNCGNQKLHYIDICSLYPYVNSTCDYPVGHPDEVIIAPIFDEKKDSQLSLEKRKLIPVCDRDDTIYSLSQTDVEAKILNEQFFGLIKCLVLPTRSLLIPVLPLKFASKMFFPFCKTCVDMKHTKTFGKLFLGAECEHDGYQERMFWGTFVTKQLRLALLSGYRIADVSEVWSWKEEKRSKELLKRYINTFLKLKTEASGWPHCDCEVDIEDQLCHHKLQSLHEYEQRENIKLDPSKVRRNEGLRFIPKILLNSFWGYLGMRENLPKTRNAKTYSEVVKFFTSNTTKVLDAALVGDDLMFLQYQMTDDASDVPRKSNVILASFTTANARVILYSCLSKIKNPSIVLYGDTDSIMYVQDSDYQSETPDIPTGSYLGEMTNELPHDVDVDSFYSTGPKFYSISGKKLSDGKQFNIFKVKGITMNRCVENFFDQNAFRNLVLAEIHSLKSPYHSLRRCIKTGRLTNQHCNKVVRVTSNRSIFLSAL